MTQDAFRMMLWYIHFVNDDNLPAKGSPQYHPLQKVKPLFDCIQSALTKAWTLGKCVCVDESMIKYMGRKVTYVQYNPNKPIKHGVKVFVYVVHTPVCYIHLKFTLEMNLLKTDPILLLY